MSTCTRYLMRIPSAFSFDPTDSDRYVTVRKALWCPRRTDSNLDSDANLTTCRNKSQSSEPATSV